MTNHHQPINQSKRTAIIDILRGWALFGVAVGNYSGFQHIGIPNKTKNSILSEVLHNFDQFFLAGKSWTLLTILFGYGFAILINNVKSKGRNPVLFFSWRMLLLFVFAFINSLFWFGDILRDYAFLGLILLFFSRSSAKTLGYISAILILAVPFIMVYVKGFSPEKISVLTNPEYLKLYHSGNWLDFFKFNLTASFYEQIIVPGYAITAHIVMLACMLFGVLLQKIDFFNRLNEMKKNLKYVLIFSIPFLVLLGLSFYFAVNNKIGFIKFFHPYFWFIISTMLPIATGICLLYINGKLKTIFTYFSACGKMTLTNYIFQNILGAFIFSGIGLGIGNTMPYWFYFSLAVFVFIIQLFISKWWLSKYNYGPIEWLWRSASYRELFPFKKPTENNIPIETNTQIAK
ncbi:DUF418 domain-containing protein [Flavobacterium sp. 140616W15]|uniref:DUF418 domain-containing protein n=1 Tax=Flavobacterium sp. 140616W15 TaxID=2478552 RepID=UPI000F0D01D9|nr:DUF418 domain-containing protein [Flavobacterium sp. 140616W15]AYN05660.1 DUF418 domain-containing protein [Flavobacterium sp. 140616W15]